MKMNITCPSAWPWLAPATTNARPAAFTMTSSDIRINSRLRRTSSPITPSANKIPARVRPCDIGMDAMSFSLQFHAVFPAEVVCPHQSCEQEHRGQLDRDEVGAVKRQADAHRRNLRHRLNTEPWTRKDVHDFSGQNRRQNRGTRPNRRSEPGAFKLARARA